MSQIVDLVPAKDRRDELVKGILDEFKKISKIVRLKEEDNVIRSVIRGESKASIIRRLQKEYPSDNFFMGDLDDFLYSYKELLSDEKTKLETAAGRRLIKQQEGLTNELIDLAQITKSLVNKYDTEGDNANTIAAIKTAADIFMKVGKIEGIFNEKPEVSVNMQLDKTVTEITSGNSDFKKSILRIVNSDEPEPETIDAEIVKDGGNGEEDVRADSDVVHNRAE